MKFKVHITQRILLNFEVEVEGNDKEDAMRNFEYENGEGHFTEDWLDAHDYADVLEESIEITEV